MDTKALLDIIYTDSRETSGPAFWSRPFLSFLRGLVLWLWSVCFLYLTCGRPCAFLFCFTSSLDEPTILRTSAGRKPFKRACTLLRHSSQPEDSAPCPAQNIHTLYFIYSPSFCSILREYVYRQRNHCSHGLRCGREEHSHRQLFLPVCDCYELLTNL